MMAIVIGSIVATSWRLSGGNDAQNSSRASIRMIIGASSRPSRSGNLAYDNVQRFTLAGAAHGTLHGDPIAGIRAGERKTC